jgi:hypothetical protein
MTPGMWGFGGDGADLQGKNNFLCGVDNGHTIGAYISPSERLH